MIIVAWPEEEAQKKVFSEDERLDMAADGLSAFILQRHFGVDEQYIDNPGALDRWSARRDDANSAVAGLMAVQKSMLEEGRIDEWDEALEENLTRKLFEHLQQNGHLTGAESVPFTFEINTESMDYFEMRVKTDRDDVEELLLDVFGLESLDFD